MLLSLVHKMEKRVEMIESLILLKKSAAGPRVLEGVGVPLKWKKITVKYYLCLLSL